jgi:hypothetical protein
MEYYFDNGVMRDLSSGETEALEAEQNLFNTWMQDTTDDDFYWEFSDTFADQKEMQEKFFQYIGEHIKSIPAYEYVLRYLMLRYNISIGNTNCIGLWKYLGDKSWKIDTKADQTILWNRLKRASGEEPAAFTDADYKLLMSVIYLYLKEEYEEKANGLVKGAFTTYFYNLINKFSASKLKDLALVQDMDLETYQLFKIKVLKNRENNFLNHDDVMIYLSLKYAADCEEDNYTAYQKLASMYPEDKMTATEAKKKLAELNSEGNSDNTSVAIEEWSFDFLEDEGRLKESMKDILFNEFHPELAVFFERINILSSANVDRSCQKVFREQWKRFFTHVEKYYLFEINDKIQTDKEKKRAMEKPENNRDDSSQESQLDRHKIFRWLYGNHVEYLKVKKKDDNEIGRHINDISDKDMVKLAPKKPGIDEVYEDFFLDSQEFLDTRIRDNDFNAATFTKDETRQRNLLLTMGFLNFVSEEDGSETRSEKKRDYTDKILDFEFEMVDLLQSCGFMPLYSGNAYDAFLKMLLASDDPLELFHYIWSLKTNSKD